MIDVVLKFKDNSMINVRVTPEIYTLWTGEMKKSLNKYATIVYARAA